MNIDSKQRIHLAIAFGAIVAVVLGYSIFGNSGDAAQTSASAPQNNFSEQRPVPQGGYGDTPGGSGQRGGPGGPGRQGGPGRPEQVTGTNAAKAKAAAEDKVDGTAEVVLKSRSGSGYTVIVRTDDGPVMVELDEDFKVTDKRELELPPGAGQRGGIQ